VKESRNHIFEGRAEKITRSTYQYDDYGNATQVWNKGEESDSSGSHQINTEYAYNSAAWIMGMPTRTTMLDEAGQKVSEQTFLYQGIDLVEKRTWLSSTNAFVGMRYAYDVYGNVIQTTDPLGRTSSVEYDATFHAFPIKTTNPLGHVQSASYDPIFGQVTSSTDSNGVTSQTRYDVFGRPTKVIGPNASELYPSTVYFYDLSSRPIRTTVAVNQTNNGTSWTTGMT
jgi:YD repeat-containing protein